MCEAWVGPSLHKTISAVPLQKTEQKHTLRISLCLSLYHPNSSLTRASSVALLQVNARLGFFLLSSFYGFDQLKEQQQRQCAHLFWPLLPLAAGTVIILYCSSNQYVCIRIQHFLTLMNSVRLFLPFSSAV